MEAGFFEAGGWGMYPTLVFGFLLLAAVALHALRGDPRHLRVALALGVVTIGAGMLGTVAGVCASCRYIGHVPPAEQLQTLAAGIEESLHNALLAGIIVVIAGLLHALAALRRPRHAPA